MISKQCFFCLILFLFLSVQLFAQQKSSESSAAVISNTNILSNNIVSTNILSTNTGSTNSLSTNFLSTNITAKPETNSSIHTNSAATNAENKTGTESGVSDNIVFESYDEVIMQNFDKENITHIKFLGNVKILFDNNILKARRVVITSVSNTVLDISAFDKVEFKYGENTYLADFLSFNPNTKRGVLKNIRTFIKNTGGGPSSVSVGGTTLSGSYGWYVHAKKATIIDPDKVLMEDVSATFTPEEFPQYHFFATRLWYFKNDVVYALADNYSIGQTDFFPIPFFMQWGRYTGIKTAFGQEKRIGWYILNGMDFEDQFGRYDYGLDIYERLGQYFVFNFNNAKPLGIFNTLNLNLQLANDTRVSYDPVLDRYNNLVQLNDGTWTNIQQASWYYKISGTIQTNNLSVSFSWEDLNDPFFMQKYAQKRSTFDAKGPPFFDFKEVVQPYNNYFYTLTGDTGYGGYSGFTRSFSMKYYNLNISGAWNYTYRYVPEITNKFLNEQYQYYISSYTFPTISYSLDPLTIFQGLRYARPVDKTITVGGSNIVLPLEAPIESYFSNIHMSNVTAYEFSNTNVFNAPNSMTNTNFTGLKSTNSNSVIISSNTNVLPSNGSVRTNEFVFFDYSSGFSGNLSFTPNETLDTNQQLINNGYNHTENASISINGNLLNSLFNNTYSISINNTKNWSSFSDNFSNNLLSSGMEIDLNAGLGINQQSYSFFTNTFLDMNYYFSLNQGLSYQVLRTIYNTVPRNANFSSTFNNGFSFLKDPLGNKIFAFSFDISYNMTYRLTNITDDYYINNMIAQTVSSSPTLTIWWFTLSTSFGLSILDTQTNSFSGSFFQSPYTAYTNRLTPNGSQVLNVSFNLPAAYQAVLNSLYLPIPYMTYKYDLIQQSNVSFDLSTGYSIKNISGLIFYNVESFDISGVSFHWDFQNPRNSTFTFSFGTKVWFDRNWDLQFSTSVYNRNLYQYLPDSLEKYGGVHIDFWQNLWDSINIFNYDGLKRGLFKIGGLNFTLEHLINEWQLLFTFSVTRLKDPTGYYYYWEPDLKIEFNLLAGGLSYPPYENKFVPANLQ